MKQGSFCGFRTSNLRHFSLLTGSRISAYRLPVFWKLQMTGWGLFMLFGFFARAVYRHDIVKSLVLTLLMEPIGLGLSCGLRWVYGRARLRSGFTMWNMFVISASSSLMAVAEVACNVGWDWWSGWAFTPRAPMLTLRFVFYLMVFMGWSVVYLWLKAEFRSRTEREQFLEAEQAAQRAELQMLRLQLNPHFMFNSLNNIATEILQRPQVAFEMTCRLAGYLRYSLDHRDELIVPLSRELDAVVTYLAIEEERFGGNLQVSIDTDPQVKELKVPCFLLQPLVENAVKHGLSSGAPPWLLGIKVWQEDERLWIQVHNSGALMPDNRRRTDTGTGLANLRRRLELHFPARHRFSLREQEGRVYSEIVLEGLPCTV